MYNWYGDVHIVAQPDQLRVVQRVIKHVGVGSIPTGGAKFIAMFRARCAPAPIERPIAQWVEVNVGSSPTMAARIRVRLME